MNSRIWNFSRALATAALILGMSGCTTPTARKVSDSPPVSATLPILIPADFQDHAYLGLPEAATEFSLEEIPGEALIIDCFDMYCHACQTGAKRVHALYDLVQERKLGARIRFVGLGVGNTPLETSLFQRKLQVPFPAFPDRSNEIAEQFGTVRLPSLIVLRRPSVAAGWQLVYHHPGIPTDPEGFLDQLLEDLAAPQPDLSNHRGTMTLPECGGGECPPLVVSETNPHQQAL